MELQRYEQEHLDRLRPLLPECTVLLKKNGDFPLAGSGKIALYGNGVRRTVKGGTGSGEVNSRFFETVEDGFREVGFTITSGAWLDGYDRIYEEAVQDFHEEIRRRAQEHHTHPVIEGMGAVMPEPEYDLPLDAEGDTAIYVLARISGEGSDRTAEAGDIFLTESEKRTILELKERYPQTADFVDNYPRKKNLTFSLDLFPWWSAALPEIPPGTLTQSAYFRKNPAIMCRERGRPGL